MLIAKVAVENTTYSFDIAYDYLVPTRLEAEAKPGCRVLVMFGKAKQKRQGLIMSVENTDNSDLKNIKAIDKILDRSPILSSELLDLVLWMKKRYFCTLFDAVKLMYPVGLNYDSIALYRIAETQKDHDIQNLSYKQINILELLKNSKKAVKQSELLKLSDLGDIESLESIGLIKKDYSNIRKASDKSIKMAKLAQPDKEKPKLTSKQNLVYELLLKMGEVSLKEICYHTGVGVNVVDRLQSKGLVKYFDKQEYRIPYNKNNIDNIKKFILSEEQNKVFQELYNKYQSPKPCVHLLYGVTGSGKTSVYLNLIDKVINDGKNVILMVPEIALTAQVINLFKAHYGSKVAVFHSALSMGERMDEWTRVKNGLAKIAVGTRSAIFAPVNNLGLIIMDEEQESSYKSSASPRFHARDVAKYRCLNHNAMLLLSSATPSVESFYMAKTGKYGISILKNRYGAAELPSVDIVDMNAELLNGNATVFSELLLSKIQENIKNKCQSILLLNRRGYHTFASCRICSHVITCPNCSISLTYHHANNHLMCHYCGYSMEFTSECPNCKENRVKYSGFGTQKVEQDLKTYLSEARILRMDADTTMAKYSHEDKLKKFEDGEYDILVGTQMVAKGLNFPNVTLVGVILADLSLYSDDFRSYERTFDLLTQVVGRGGRGIKKGEAIIQTFTPENYVINLAATQNYDEFYNSEIALRKVMLYPPFVDICIVGFVGIFEDITRDAASCFSKMLSHIAKLEYSEQPIRVIGPSAALVSKISNKYRFRLIIKCKNNKRFRDMISKILLEFAKEKKFKKISIFVDINPDSII